MADTSETQPTAPVTAADPTPAAPEPKQQQEEQLGDAGKRALDAERKRARELEKQLSAAQARLNEIDEAGKTELQKAADRAAKAEADYQAAVTELARERIAREHRLSDADTALLAGTEEQMRTLAARLASQAPKAPVVPTEGTHQPLSTDIAAQAEAAQAAGDKNTALSLKAQQLAGLQSK